MYLKQEHHLSCWASSVIFKLLCRLVVSRLWFARCFGPETEKTSQNQRSVPCATLRQGTRTPRWRRMPSDCTTAYPWWSNYCTLHHTGPSLRYAFPRCSLNISSKRLLVELNLPSKSHVTKNVFVKSLCARLQWV